MSLFFGQKSHRRARTTRAAAIGAPWTLAGRLGEIVRDRNVLLRLLLCLATVLALVVAVEGWKAPFVYRHGDRPPRGVLAQVKFSRIDERETERARSQSEARVPLFFSHDPELLRKLAAEFRVDLEEVGRTDALESLSPAARQRFGLATQGDANRPGRAEEHDRHFLTLRAALLPEPTVKTLEPQVSLIPTDSTAVELAPPRLDPPAAIRDATESPKESDQIDLPTVVPHGIEAQGGILDPGGDNANRNIETAGQAETDVRSDGQDRPSSPEILLVASAAETAAAEPNNPPAESDSLGQRIDQLLSQFSRLIAPLEQYGILNPADAARYSIHPDQRLAIMGSDQGGETSTVFPADVLVDDLLTSSGRLEAMWVHAPNLAPLRAVIEHWLRVKLPVTLQYESSATQQARLNAEGNVEPVEYSYIPGDVLVGAGKRIDTNELAVLSSEYNAIERTVPLDQRLLRVVVVFLMILVLAVLNGYYLVQNEPRLVGSLSRLSVYLAVIVATVAFGRLLSFDPWRAELIPLVVTVIVFAIAYNQVLATLTAFTLSLLLTLSTTADLGQFVVLMSVSATAVIPLTEVSSRTTLIKVGFATAAVYFFVTWGTSTIDSQSVTALWSDNTVLYRSLAGAGWCLVAGYLIAGSLPFIESSFGVVTDISLLEMSDISQPLLQELVRRAPGTYNHSIAVATIGEAAAEHIGANGLMVRVGAYYHDVGKMLKPQYFVENMTEGSRSRHDDLAPAMSTLIIIGHVKDGVDLAHQHDLPPPLIDFIEQHHGTTLVEYFYREATKIADQEPDHRTNAEESSFRYPGPKPQSREAAVMMLADSVESASRTLSDPTPKRIETLVHKITMEKLLDGQFEECPITLREIQVVEDSLTRSLIGIYHGRIKYPEKRSA